MPCFPIKTPPSLALLQSPLDFVVTTNHAALWQKHVAWAKPDGSQLKQYITGHYSSIMILLSLLLTASINVFFNPSHEIVEMRSLLVQPSQHQQHLTHLKFWTGLLILLDIFVTLLGLVTTFTLWSMISAVSDANSHCILRSSLGQYAISLPPRLVVGSLYIFLLWTLLFVLELVAHPISWIVVLVVLLFFFAAIIIPLSALGRLIVHTGAMAQRPILPPALETQLLPSGLYSSLLLRATHRQRRNPYNVTRQYRSTVESTADEVAVAAAAVEAQSQGESEDDLSSFDKNAVRLRFEGSGNGLRWTSKSVGTGLLDEDDPPMESRNNHLRRQSVDTLATEVPLPHASVLNAAISSQDLFHLMESTIRSSSRKRTAKTNGTNENHREQTEDHNLQQDFLTVNRGLNEGQSAPDPISPAYDPGLPPRRSNNHHRRASSTILLNEWTEEVDVRDLYGLPMPAELPPEEIAILHDSENANTDQQVHRWSLWASASLGQLFEDEVEPGGDDDNDDASPVIPPSRSGAISRIAQLREPLLSSSSPPLPSRREREGGDEDNAEGSSLGSLRGENLLNERPSDVVCRNIQMGLTYRNEKRA